MSSSSNTVDEAPVFNMDAPPHSSALKLAVLFNGVILPFEVDSGSAITAISENFYRQHFITVPLKPTSTMIKPYSEPALNPLGIAVLNFTYNGKTGRHDVLVIRDGGPPILGRSWLHSFVPDWTKPFR